jgi:hypothetical protein
MSPEKAEWLEDVRAYYEENDEFDTQRECPECGHSHADHDEDVCPSTRKEGWMSADEIKRLIPRADAVKKTRKTSPLVEEVEGERVKIVEKIVEKVVAPPPPKLDMGATIFPQFETGQGLMDKWLVVIIGAGGVGARLAPLLIKHLTVGDRLFIVDGDNVEAKNIMRQHFTPGDIGLPKAQVVAQRARATAPREGTEVGFLNEYLQGDLLAKFMRALFACRGMESNTLFGERAPTTGIDSVMVISCVDTLKARKDFRQAAINEWFNYNPGNFIWIDCGNATANGQAMVTMLGSARGFKCAVTGETPRATTWGNQLMEPWKDILPGFLDRDDPPPAAGDACAVRLDEQSVLANAWAAIAAATVAIPIITFSGIRTMGMGFSVAGSSIISACSEEVLKHAGHRVPTKWVSRRLA